MEQRPVQVVVVMVLVPVHHSVLSVQMVELTVAQPVVDLLAAVAEAVVVVAAVVPLPEVSAVVVQVLLVEDQVLQRV